MARMYPCPECAEIEGRIDGLISQMLRLSGEAARLAGGGDCSVLVLHSLRQQQHDLNIQLDTLHEIHRVHRSLHGGATLSDPR